MKLTSTCAGCQQPVEFEGKLGEFNMALPITHQDPNCMLITVNLLAYNLQILKISNHKYKEELATAFEVVGTYLKEQFDMALERYNQVAPKPITHS